jgi:hypothetical protein
MSSGRTLALLTPNLQTQGTVRPPAAVYQRNLPADDEPIVPSDVATAINDLFDRHGIMPMTADVGDCLFTAMEIENTALAVDSQVRIRPAFVPLTASVRCSIWEKRAAPTSRKEMSDHRGHRVHHSRTGQD